MKLNLEDYILIRNDLTGKIEIVRKTEEDEPFDWSVIPPKQPVLNEEETWIETESWENDVSRQINLIEADAWAKKIYGQLEVSDKERAALTAYQNRATGVCKRITDLIRNAKEKDADPVTLAQIEAIDAVIARSILPQSCTAYVVIDSDEDKHLIFDLAYMSVFLSFKHIFARHYHKARNPLILKIFLPKKTRGVYLTQFTDPNPYDNESEFLLQRNTHLRTTKVRSIEIEGRTMLQMSATLYQPKPGSLF